MFGQITCSDRYLIELMHERTIQFLLRGMNVVECTLSFGDQKPQRHAQIEHWIDIMLEEKGGLSVLNNIKVVKHADFSFANL
jgi:hypothetical protein